jgi:hypothetical protein
MLKAKKLPGMFWGGGEAVVCAVYLLNKTTSKSINGKTPYELWTGTTLAVSHLRVFGCVAHVNATKPNIKKLEDRSKPMIFVGYEAGSTAYRCYDPCTKRVHISRDVIFDEDACWNWSGDLSENLCSDFTVGGDSKIIQTIETDGSSRFFRVLTSCRSRAEFRGSACDSSIT